MDKLNYLIIRFAANPYGLSGNEIGLPTGASNLSVILTRTVQGLMIVIGMLSVIFIIVGALQMVGSAGDPKRFKMGREAVLYSVVGIFISIAAFAIVTFIARSTN